MTRLVLDAGAFIAADRHDLRLLALLDRAHARSIPLLTSSPVVAQVWRTGRLQANLARLLRGVQIIAPDDAAARRAGLLLAKTGTSDVVDAFVAGLCRSTDALLTSDPDDLSLLSHASGVDPEIVSI